MNVFVSYVEHDRKLNQKIDNPHILHFQDQNFKTSQKTCKKTVPQQKPKKKPPFFHGKSPVFGKISHREAWPVDGSSIPGYKFYKKPKGPQLVGLDWMAIKRRPSMT